MAGLGTRVRPHSLVQPKALLSIAGKPVLQHIMDYLLQLTPTEFIFVISPGDLGGRVRQFMQTVYPAVAAQIMVDSGSRLIAHQATVWEDTGTIDAILGTNGSSFHALRFLVERAAGGSGIQSNCIIVPPVYVSDTATLTECVVGPYVSV